MLESTAGIFKSRSSVVSKLEPTVALTLGDPGRAPCNTAIELTTETQHTGMAKYRQLSSPGDFFHRLTPRAVVRIAPKIYLYE